ncbi:diaminopimelate decarboxylase [Xanthovirga aplysinae]|uniref:diaminopimelate decarboxylase n=1 Tax=Xanthovirga aplysinae TaxID=2529853 RepID=UPI0012BCB2F7|nr:diaminopimelate decarboxylase [Xanthovirga aplysinae]MTI30756.1 diaminopimelate decarboxylase [Xanthovirga aplysinae]
MDQFNYSPEGVLHCEDININSLVEKVGTPLYVYSANSFRDHYKRFKEAFAAIDPLICFSIKTCNNIHLIQELVELGSGIDTVSGGEIFLARQANTPADKIVYAGIGKTDEEIAYALDEGIGVFNIESEEEFENISRIAAQKKKRIKAALRVTPDVIDARTHDKTKTGNRGSKFGVDIERAKAFFNTYGKDEYVDLCGVHIHIGSPIYTPKPYELAIRKITSLIDYLTDQGHDMKIIDIGGGYSADYSLGMSPKWEEFAEVIVPLLKPYYDKGMQVIMEPGRTISANSGVLLTEVNYVKKGGDKQFAVVNTGMHHLLRPAMYEAEHFMWPGNVEKKHLISERIIDKEEATKGLEKYDVVGPICESSDYLAKGRNLPQLKRGDLLCIFTAGAYGMVMSSQYNAMPRPAEVMIDGEEIFLIRERESYQDLLTGLEKRKID